MASSSHVVEDSFITVDLFGQNDDRSPLGTKGIVKQYLDPTCSPSISNYRSSKTSPRSDLSTPNSLYQTARDTIGSLSTDTLCDLSPTNTHEFSDQFHNFDETITQRTLSSVYQTCVESPVRGIIKRSKSIRQQFRRGSLSSLLDRLPKLQRLSVARGESINIESTKPVCSCRSDFTDGNCLRNFMKMSVQPAEYRNGSQVLTSTPINPNNMDYDQSIFNVARFKKVELHDLKPKVPEIHAIETPTKDLCINNNNTHTPNGNHYNQQTDLDKFIGNVTPIAPLRSKGQLITNAMTKQSLEDGNVLKKVISFTLEQMNNGDNQTSAICKTSRPIFVPEKLHFSDYNQFEGQMLVKWISSSITKTCNLNENDLGFIEMLIAAICTYLIEAGVMKQIVDNNEDAQDVFCLYRMYQWAHAENHNENRPKKRIYQNVENKQNDNASETNKSFEAIKSRLLACDSVTSLYAEMKSVMNDIEDRASTNHEPLNGLDCVDRDEIKIKPDGFCKNCKTKQQSCDTKLERSSVDKGSQTEHSMESDAKTDSKQVTPIPPPLPNFLLNSLAESDAAKQSSPIPIPPPLPNFLPYSPAVPTITVTKPVDSDKENVPVTKQASTPVPPPPPPLPVLSSASSFCPPKPPPMPGNGIPPPLPLPSGDMWFRTETLRKPDKIPKKPMISLFWTRILAPKPEEEEKEETVNSTSTMRKKSRELWQDIDETIIENVDDFAEMFSRTSTPKKMKSAVKIPRKACIKVLDSKRSQSVGIFAQNLHRLRIDSKLIEQAIYNWDTQRITLDLLQQMRDHRASPDELKLIKDAVASKSDTPLDGPEKFLLNFSSISCALERIDCILFRSEFEEATGHIDRKINTVRHLCEFLIDNEHLKDLFSIILTLGNFMNGGNRYRGQADGFGLDVLNKLRDVKSKDKKISLLHYIIRTFIDKRRKKGLKLKVPGADEVKQACLIDFVDVNEQINQLKANLSDFERKMKIVIESSNESIVQPFKEISETFIRMARSTVEEQCVQLSACKQIFRETLEFFKHKPKTGTNDECTPSQFFELWSSFVADFYDLWKREFATITAELAQKNKRAPSPRVSANRTIKGTPKPTGLRVRRIKQI